MEQMTGLEVQTELLKVSPLTHVIIITGRRDPTAERNAEQAGATAFFTKPFDDKNFCAPFMLRWSQRRGDKRSLM
jgi:FixJ family two-component response regulator